MPARTVRLKLTARRALAFLQTVHRLPRSSAQGPVRVHLEHLLQVAAGPGALAGGGQGRGAVVVGDAELGVELYGAVGGLDRGLGVARGVEAGGEGRVVAGEGAAA